MALHSLWIDFELSSKKFNGELSSSSSSVFDQWTEFELTTKFKEKTELNWELQFSFELLYSSAYFPKSISFLEKYRTQKSKSEVRSLKHVSYAPVLDKNLMFNCGVDFIEMYEHCTLLRHAVQSDPSIWQLGGAIKIKLLVQKKSMQPATRYY